MVVKLDPRVCTLVERSANIIDMKIDLFMNPADICTTNGYGNAGLNMVKSLQHAGHQINLLPTMASDSDIRINFAFPSIFADYLDPKQYNIYYCVWESTQLQPDWYEILEEVDEIWTASPWCKQMLENEGFEVTNVWPHGIENIWKPRRRSVSNHRFKFLHDGEPTSRKNGQMAFNAFRAAFGNSQDVELIIKSKGQSSIREYNLYGNIVGVPSGNVRVVTEVYENFERMVSLYHSSHCLIMPTAGEGFGFPALQALATGMPAIVTEECAPYQEFLGGLGLKSTYIDSPWQDMHPGKILQPDFDDLVEKMRFVYANQDSLLPAFYRQSWKVHSAYDWNTLTSNSLEKIVGKFDKQV